MYKLVLIRHGQSVWNKEDLFTGWTDVDLSEQGVKEAQNAGEILKENGYEFDMAFTSYLKRAIKTLDIVLEKMDLMWIPVIKAWQINERHYGDLQGKNKIEMAKEVGKEQVHIWRRSFDIKPPALEPGDDRDPANESRYDALTREEKPLTECLKDTIERVMPYYENVIVPEIKAGKKVIISAHGNSLRAMVKYFDNISDEEITGLNIPTGVPLVYELDENLKPIKSYYLKHAA